jgi:hypothetical protein
MCVCSLHASTVRDYDDVSRLFVKLSAILTDALPKDVLEQRLSNIVNSFLEILSLYKNCGPFVGQVIQNLYKISNLYPKKATIFVLKNAKGVQHIAAALSANHVYAESKLKIL